MRAERNDPFTLRRAQMRYDITLYSAEAIRLPKFKLLKFESKVASIDDLLTGNFKLSRPALVFFSIARAINLSDLGYHQGIAVEGSFFQESVDETEYPIADYADTAEKNILQLRADSGNQAGDPVRAAEAIVQAVESPNPPHRLLLGNDAYDGAIAKLDELRAEFNEWEAVSRGADFTEVHIQEA